MMTLLLMTAAWGQQPAPVREAILRLKPAGDPITFVEETAADRTHRVPKVAAISRDGEGTALAGWDPVSYLNRKPERGRKHLTHTYSGVVWRFASEENRRRFVEDPEAYVPAYGGFCAYSIGRGYPVTSNPAVYAIESGRIVLFFDKAVQLVWEQDPGMTVKAARNWPRLHLPAE